MKEIDYALGVLLVMTRLTSMILSILAALDGDYQLGTWLILLCIYIAIMEPRWFPRGVVK